MKKTYCKPQMNFISLDSAGNEAIHNIHLSEEFLQTVLTGSEHTEHSDQLFQDHFNKK